MSKPANAITTSTNAHGLAVGQLIYFGARRRWYQRAWHWFARVVLRRKTPPSGFARIVSITPTVLTLDGVPRERSNR